MTHTVSLSFYLAVSTSCCGVYLRRIFKKGICNKCTSDSNAIRMRIRERSEGDLTAVWEAWWEVWGVVGGNSPSCWRTWSWGCRCCWRLWPWMRGNGTGASTAGALVCANTLHEREKRKKKKISVLIHEMCEIQLLFAEILTFSLTETYQNYVICRICF